MAPQRFDYQLKLIGKSEDLVNALKSATEALDTVNKKTKANNASFTSLAASAATAFASIKFVLADSVAGFFEAEKASKQLEQALKQQGIFSIQTMEAYDDLANGLSRLIGIDDDAAKAVFARGQALLGNIPITERLTQATADLAAGMNISFEEAFEKVTRSIGTSKNALKEFGVTVEKGAESQVKMEQVISGLEARFRGQAEAARGGDVSIKALGVSLGNLQEKIGERLAPTITRVADALTALLDRAKDNPTLVSFATGLGIVAAAVSGLAVAINGASFVLAGLSSAAAVAAPVLSALVSPIALVAAGLTAAWIALENFGGEFYGFFDGVFFGTLKTASEAMIGLSKTIAGVFDASLFEEGLNQFLGSFKAGLDAAMNAYRETKSEFEADDAVPFGPERKPEGTQDPLEKSQSGIRAEQAEAEARAASERAEEWRQYEINRTRDAYERIEKEQKATNDRKLKEEEKFRKQNAIISKVFTKDEVDTFRESSNEMAQLAQSKNATLKGIGKAYALSNIAISTAEMATKAYSALAGIPLIGPALGAAAAAAAIAFGVERAGDVLAANTGGFVPGSGPNKDTMPAMLTSGEFITPRNSADEVINAVAAQRSGTHASNEDVVEALGRIEERLGQPGTVTLKNEGAGDPLLELFERLNYYLEFKNFRLFGVQTT